MPETGGKMLWDEEFRGSVAFMRSLKAPVRF
jgi:hypothetical protein